MTDAILKEITEQCSLIGSLNADLVGYDTIESAQSGLWVALTPWLEREYPERSHSELSRVATHLIECWVTARSADYEGDIAYEVSRLDRRLRVAR